MIIRIKGIVDKIEIFEGVGESTGRPWKRKVYTIRDNSYNKQDYNRCVKVNDLGKLNKEKLNPEFIFKSNHIVGEEVDIACFIETNDKGFTHVDYWREFDDETPKQEHTSNVVRPEAPQEQEPEPVPMQEEDTSLPF